MNLEKAYIVAKNMKVGQILTWCADVGTAFLFSFSAPDAIDKPSAGNPIAVYKRDGKVCGWIPTREEIVNLNEINVDDVAGENNGN